MLHVDLQHRLGRRHLLAGGFENAAHLPAKIVCAEHQDRRGIGQAVRDAHIAHTILQRLLDALDQRRVLLGERLALLLFLCGLDGVDVQLAARHVAQLLALEVAQVIDQPLVDAIRQQQHFDALAAQNFQVRARLRRGEIVGDDEIDFLLLGLHARHVVLERHILLLLVGVRAGKAQQLGDALAIAVILGGAFLQDRAEFLPERRVLLRLFLRHFRQQIQHTPRQTRADAVDGCVLLQHLARDVQRQVGRIHHALHEAQVERQELLGVVHDEDAAHVQLEAARRLAMPQVVRRPRRHVQQAGVFLLAFDLAVRPGERVREIVRDVAIELLVFVVLHIAARPGPQRLRVIDGLVFRRCGVLAFLLFFFLGVHAHGESDVIGILPHQRADAIGVGEILLALLQVQHDARAALRQIDGRDGEFAVAARLPVHTRSGIQAGATRIHVDAVGDDERGIEADAELADQLRVLLLIAGHAGEEFGGARLGNRTEVLDGFLAAHADAVIGDGDRARLRVGIDGDGELTASLQQIGLGQRLETQLVERVRSVGNQLAQEDFLVTVERMDHQLEQLLDLRLKAQGLRWCLRCLAHLDPSLRVHGEKCRIIGDAGAYGDPGKGFKGNASSPRRQGSRSQQGMAAR